MIEGEQIDEAVGRLFEAREKQRFSESRSLLGATKGDVERLEAKIDAVLALLKPGVLSPNTTTMEWHLPVPAADVPHRRSPGVRLPRAE